MRIALIAIFGVLFLSLTGCGGGSGGSTSAPQAGVEGDYHAAPTTPNHAVIDTVHLIQQADGTYVLSGDVPYTSGVVVGGGVVDGTPGHLTMTVNGVTYNLIPGRIAPTMPTSAG